MVITFLSLKSKCVQSYFFRTPLLRTLATTNTEPFKPAKGRVPRDKTDSSVEVIQALKQHKAPL